MASSHRVSPPAREPPSGCDRSPGPAQVLGRESRASRAPDVKGQSNGLSPRRRESASDGISGVYTLRGTARSRPRPSVTRAGGTWPPARARADTFLQTQNPHGVQGVDQRKSQAKPLAEGPGHGFQLVVAPGELAVSGPRVAEGLYHGPLTLVRGGCEEESESWALVPLGDQTLCLCSPRAEGQSRGVGAGGTLSRATGQRCSALKVRAQGRRWEPRSWTRRPMWRRRSLQALHVTSRPLVRLAWSRPPAPDARQARPSGAAGDARGAAALRRQTGARRPAPRAALDNLAVGGWDVAGPVTWTRAPRLTGPHVVP